jgi:PKD repeat protein
VSLIVSDGLVWSEPDSLTIGVTDLLPPVAVATATPTAGVVPLTVQFDGSQSYDPQGGTLYYRWDFGDHSPLAFEVSPVHTFTAAGTFVAIHAVQDELGQVDADTVTITVGTTPTKPSTWGRIKALYH